MGYTTDFTGAFTLDKPLKPEHAAYLREFANTRRMKRNAQMTEKMSDPIRKAVGLPVGEEGCYFVGSGDNNPDRQKSPPERQWGDFHGQAQTPDIVNYNGSPAGQPGLWCAWEPTEDDAGIEWNGAEKFYDYTEWLEYLIANFLKPWGYVLNGEVEWQGEDRGDIGKLVVKDNVVRAVEGRITYEE